MNDTKYLVYLHSIWFSQRKLASIFAQQANYKQVFDSITSPNLKKLWFLDKQIEKILENKQKLDTNYIDKKLNTYDIKIITLWDDTYPKLLKKIHTPPYVLYTIWDISSDPCIAVIGSRKMSSYGARVISKIVWELSRRVTIVSGGAYGCDSEAHKTCIEQNAKTYVVIGTGIDLVYPVSNRELYQQVVTKWWAIISIFPLWEPGNPHNFPIRNEIISGISLGTLVIEAWEKSGTLITAQLALDQGRDVFAVPWEIDKTNSLGCNRLIANGWAKITLSANDILEEYPFLRHESVKSEQIITDPKLLEIHQILSFEPLFLDEISEKLKKSISEIWAQISLLEMQKIIRKNTEGKYELC